MSEPNRCDRCEDAGVICSAARPLGSDSLGGPTRYVGVMRCPDPEYESESDLIGVCRHWVYCGCRLGFRLSEQYPRAKQTCPPLY